MCPEKFKHRYKQTKIYQEGIFTRNAAHCVLAGMSSTNFQKFYSLKVPNVNAYYGAVQCFHTSRHIAGNVSVFLFFLFGLHYRKLK
jgi:hypothetical protein